MGTCADKNWKMWTYPSLVPLMHCLDIHGCQKVGDGSKKDDGCHLIANSVGLPEASGLDDTQHANSNNKKGVKMDSVPQTIAPYKMMDSLKILRGNDHGYDSEKAQSCMHDGPACSLNFSAKTREIKLRDCSIWDLVRQHERQIHLRDVQPMFRCTGGSLCSTCRSLCWRERRR